MVYKIPPAAKELEEIVLGVMMMERDAVDAVSLILKPECFYLEIHQRICRTIFSLANRNQMPDITTVVETLRKSGELEICGGAYGVTMLTDKVTSSANIENWCRIILEKWMLREIISVTGKMFTDAFEPAIDVFALLETAEKGILGIADKHISTEMSDMTTVLSKAMKKIDQWRLADTGMTGTPSGFPRVDSLTRGWQDGDLVILAARPSVGKTAFALHMGMAAADHFKKIGSGKSVAIWSLEMDAIYLAIRMLASTSQTMLDRLLRGKLDDAQLEWIYKDGIQKLSNKGIFFDDRSNLTVYTLKSKARRMKKRHNLGLIIVDYLQLMSGDEKSGSREQEISKISRNLKILAKELDVPIIALSQLSREMEKRPGRRRVPQLSDLRESGAIEQDADAIFFLWAPEAEEIEKDPALNNQVFGRLAKYRNGSLGTITFEFKKETQEWKEYQDPSAMPGFNYVPVDHTESKKKSDEMPF